MTKKTIMNFADGPKEVFVGDTFCEVSNQHGGGSRTCTIDAIGRAYITSGRNQFNITTGSMKTEYAGSKAWSSKDAYEEHLRAIKAKKDFIELVKSTDHNVSRFWLAWTDLFREGRNFKKD